MNDNIKKFASKSRSMFLISGYVGGVFKFSNAVWYMPCGYGGQERAVDARAFSAAMRVAGKGCTIDRDGRMVGALGSVHLTEASGGMIPGAPAGAVTGEGITFDLRVLAPYASTDDVRSNICGVHVTCDGWAVATNGHVLCAQPVTVTARAECTVPVELAAIASSVTLYPDHCAGGGAIVRYVDGDYPDWRRVMPEAAGDPFTIDAPAKLPGGVNAGVLCTADADGRGWRLTRPDGLDVHVGGSGASGRVFTLAPPYLPMLAGRVCYHSGGTQPILAVGDDGSKVVVMPHHT